MKDSIHYIKHELKGLYAETEITAIVRIIIEHLYGLDFTQQVVNKNIQLNKHKKPELCNIIQRLKNFEPIQYIIGETEFYGLKFHVNPDVLIPRPETEELVQWMLESDVPETSRIMDIATGTGCIALALKKQLPDSDISACDISESALDTANRNGVSNNLNVHFFQTNILNWEGRSWEYYNVIVSNPPYVKESEKQYMTRNVLNYEPELALFVQDQNPLLFYDKIAAFTQKYLYPEGWLFFEMNESLGEEMIELLQSFKFKEIEIKKDLSGKNRMLRCRK